jgi:hypothetical protein
MRSSLVAAARLASLAALASSTAAASGCGGGSPAPSSVSCTPEAATVTSEGVVLTDACEGRVALLPTVTALGERRGGGLDGPCTASDDEVRCPAGELGEVRARLVGETLSIEMVAAQTIQVEALSLVGSLALPGATGFLSNGFQSWSQSGVVALGEPLDDEALGLALTRRADAEVLRDGKGFSWSHTWVGGPALDGEAPRSRFFAGALSAARFKPWIEVARQGDALTVALVSGGAGERVTVEAGASLAGEPFMIALEGDLEGAQLRYADALPSRRRDRPWPAEAGWNSWYDLWDAVDADAVRDNAALARQVLAERVPEGGPPLRVVIDDGWQVAWGDWAPNAKFPAGLSGLADELRADGFEVGVWLAPLLVDEDSEVALAHPEWLVGGAEYDHPKHGVMRVLDVTHPDAALHLQSVVSTLVASGLSLLKIDFLFAGTFEGERFEDVTGMQAYARALALIREAAGEDTLVLAVGAPGVPSLPFVDAWRLGGDIAFENTDVAWPFVASQARSLSARWPLCRATLCDADPVLFRGLSEGEVESGAEVVSWAGGSLFLSDDLRVLEPSRAGLGLSAERVSRALSGEPSVPLEPFPAAPPAELANVVIDLVSQTSGHVVPPVWRAPDGSLVGFNASDAPLVVRGVEIPPHGTRALE